MVSLETEAIIPKNYRFLIVFICKYMFLENWIHIFSFVQMLIGTFFLEKYF